MEMSKNLGDKILILHRRCKRYDNLPATADFVIHAAATKIVPTAEYNPFKCIKTNIISNESN